MSVQSLLQSAVQMHQSGNLDDAEQIYQQVLAAEKDNPDALHLLGIINRTKGDITGSIVLLRMAISHRADFPEAHHSLGNALVDAAQPEEAIACFRRAIALRPDYTDCWRSLAVTLFWSGDKPAALEAFEALAQRAPMPIDLLNYAILLSQFDRKDEALTHCERVIILDPHLAGAYRLRAEARSEMDGMQAEAIADMREAHRLAPEDIEIHHTLGMLLRRAGDLDEACTHFEAVVAQDSEHWLARYLLCLSQLRPIYEDTAAIEDSRQRYATHLGRLHDAVMQAGPEDLKLAADAFGVATPFLLPYQGRNDRQLQELWGGMVCHAMATRYPAAAPRPLSPRSDGRLRIGILSAHFCRHSNWKIPVKGWAQGLNRERFHLTGYFVGKHRDELTEEARRSFDCFVDGLTSLDAWAQRIQSDRLHALLIPEIGMDGLTVQLAALHLAPVQIGSWGHPETSGMPTMDYVLSSDAMEPEDGQDWYSERLVRLPNLSTRLDTPDATQRPLDLAAFGIGADSVIYLCLQNLSKYLPEHDCIFTDIARRVSNARFVFLAAGTPSIATLFRTRLQRAFAREGLEPDAFLAFLPRLLTRQFICLIAQGDVFLDSIGWSGCNTTVEALQFGIPVVTKAGGSMRSRHSAAILKLLGRADLVATTTEGYIELAVRLGQDPEYRRTVREDLRRKAPGLYNDPLPVRALDEFLERLIGDRPSDAHS